MSDPCQIFLSCGAPYTPDQELFLSRVESFLAYHDCLHLTVGRNHFSGRQPVEAARNTIAQCDGALVIAFERTLIVKGTDKPGGPEPQEIADERHPTVWNQMEASMAYAKGIPLMTLVQRGVKRQGMLSDRLEWVALERDLTPDLLGTTEFLQVFAEWLALVQKGRADRARREEAASLQSEEAARAKNDEAARALREAQERRPTVRQLFSEATPQDLLRLVGGVGGAIAAVATLSFAAGRWYEFDHASRSSETRVSSSPTSGTPATGLATEPTRKPLH